MSHYVALKSNNGKFLSLSSNGKLMCDKNDIKDCDIFTMKYEGRYVTFQTKTGKYLSASPTATLEADREKIGSAERFEIEWVDEDWFVLKANYGNYVSVQKDGKIEITQKLLQDNEKFKLIEQKVESLFEFLQF